MKKIDNNEFVRVISNIKNEIKTTQVKTMRQVNSNLITMYYRIGKVLSENRIDDYYFIGKVSAALKIDFPYMQGFSVRNLRYMRRFHDEYKDNITRQQLVAGLPWGHNIILMQKVRKSPRAIIRRLD